MIRQRRHPANEISQQEWHRLGRRYRIEGLRLTLTADASLLEGFAPSYRSKKLAGLAAAALLGTPAIVNRVRVVPASGRPEQRRRRS